jgi:hypothetical protein
VALVGQDGAEHLPLPWEHFQALFLGGSTEWKLGPGAARLAAETKRRGYWSHLGRCNTLKRFRHAFFLGCGSVDGSGFSRWPDESIPTACAGWLSGWFPPKAASGNNELLPLVLENNDSRRFPVERGGTISVRPLRREGDF